MDSNDQFITDCLSKLLDTNGSGSIEDIPKLTSIVKECIGRWRWRLLKKKTGGATPFEIKTDMIGFIDMQIKSIFARHATMKKQKENVDVRLSCESVIAVAELLFEKAALLLEWPEGDDTESPMQLSKKLYEFPNAGRLIYCRQSAIKPEKAMDASITILQLLCGNILKLKIDEGNKPKAVVTLSLTNSCPNYFNDSFWMYICHYP